MNSLLKDIEITTLPSGLRVASIAMQSIETVSVGIWIHAGSRLESLADSGVAHFLEHMSFKGTERRTAHQIAEEVEMVGGHSNAHTSKEQTAYYIKLLAEDLPLAVDILGDIVLHSTFITEELEKERGVILQEMAMYEDQPDDMVFERFQQKAYPDQPLGRSIIGDHDVVANMTARQLKNYVGSHYSADKAVLVAAGKVDHQALVSLVEQHFAAMKSFETATAEPARYKGGIIRTDYSCEQLHVVMGWPSCSYQNLAQHYTSAALAGIFGGGMSSRLFQEVREKRGLAYAVFATHIAYQDNGLFCFYTGCAPDRASEAIEIAHGILEKMRQDISDKELQKIKAQMKSSLLMSRESSSSRASTVAKHLLLYDRIIPIKEHIAHIDALSINDLADWVDKLLSSPHTLSLYGDVDQVILPQCIPS